MTRRPPPPPSLTPRGAARRRRRILPRLGLALGGLVGGLLLAEGLARLWEPRGGAELLMGVQVAPSGMYAADAELISTPVPGFQATARSLAGEVEVRLNGLGLRGPEPAPTPSGPRWLVLGDSFALSLQVPEERTFEALLARRLGQEVWNGGVDGYSTWQATRRYRRLDAALGADRVLLVYFLGNDLYENGWYPTFIQHWTVDRFQAPPEEAGARGWLERRSFLWAGLTVWRNRRAVAEDPVRMARWREELTLFTRGGAAALTAALGPTEAALTELRAETAARGDRLVVALAPPAFQVEAARAPGTLAMVGLDPADADLEAPRRAVLEALARLGIEGCDLTEALKRSSEAGARPYLVYDGHWTPAGHGAVAEALAGCLGR